MVRHRNNYFSCGNAGIANALLLDHMGDHKNHKASDYWLP
jgi:predicted outer membrane lipoprotein